MSGAWSQLEQLLTCAICLDRFRNPKLLPCQHTFCGEPCMEGLVDYARRQIKCPECRAEHRIPYNGVQSFPNNVTLTRFLDLHRGITGEEPEPLPSQMDRCGVCGEKSFCLRCAHCEKKVCEECRVAHLDILRREINRINTQVRRGVSKLAEHTEQADKNSERLLQISAQIRDEITESVRRLIKDLKDKESKLLADLDEFSVSETKNNEKLKEDLDLELSTITSNCELVEEHVTEADDWTDVELMEYKDIFLKTLDFLRNLDPDTMDFARKIKYVQKVDLDGIRRTVADFGEIKITQPAVMNPLSPSESVNNLSVPGSLVRSQSDHRLAAQFASGTGKRSDPLQRSYLDVTGQGRYGSDSERERGSSPPGRRGERFGSVHERSSRYGRTDNTDFSYTRGWARPGDSEYEPSNSANFRSRFMRERIRERTGGAGSDADHSFEEAHDSDVGSGPRVRFQEESQVRGKLFDTEEMVNLRAPLSGLIKLSDSPHVMERLHQNQIKAKQKEAEAKETEALFSSAPTPPAPTQTTPTPAPRPTRQISEDEIEKQKKQNQAAAAAQEQQRQPQAVATNASGNTSQPQTPKATSNMSPLGNDQLRNSPSTPANRRVQTLQKEDRASNGRSSSDDPSITDSRLESSEASGEDDVSATQTSTTNRRRIFASSHSTSGANGSTQASNSRSNSVDFESSSRGKAQQSSQPSGANSSYYQYHQPHQSSYYSPSQRSSLNRYGSEADSSTSYVYGRGRKISRDEDGLGSITGDQSVGAVPTSPSHTSTYYSPFGRSTRGSLSRQSTMDDDAEPDSNSYADSSSRSYGYSSYANRKNAHGNSDRYSSASSSYLKNRLAKSRSSHAIAFTSACDDSDDESNGFTGSNNPLSPSSSNYRSRFNFSDSSERYSSARRTSRSGYTYRTREPSPEEEPAGSVTQYLINKYGTRSSAASSNRPSMLSKSKSSHAIFGRSMSSSDEEITNTTNSSNATPYRRASRDAEYAYKSSSAIGSTYPRQVYLQKKRMMIKIGTRGTNPACFTWPRGVACAPDNSIVVADSSNHRIQVFDSTGRFQFEFGSYGSGEGEFDCLAGVTVNRIGHYIVSDRYNHRVQVFDASGRFLRSFGSEGRSDGKFSYPWGIATDALGFIYVCDKENHRIQVFQSDGTFVGKFGSIGSRPGMLEHPHYIAVSNTNRIVVSDSNNHRVQIFDINGRSISTFGSEGSAEGQFKFPRGVAVDENGFIIVGDSGNNRIQIFNPDGTFLKTFGQWGSGEGEFKGLEGVAISSTGNILVCDRENHRIQIF